MPVQDGVSGKVCVACGVDCADLPRAKDRRGRYFCRPCYDRAVQKARSRQAAPAAAAAARPAAPTRPRAAAVAAADPLAELAALESRGTAVMTTPRPCPSCGTPLPATERVCKRCGYDRRAGGKASVSAGAARPARAPAAAGSSGNVTGMLTSPLVVTLGQAALFVALFAVAKASPPVFLAYWAIWTIYGLAVNIWLLVTAFKVSVGTGLLCFFLAPYALYFAFAKNDNAYLKGSYAVALLAAVLLGVLVATAAAKVVDQSMLAA
jgi:hypothetical protein